MKEMKRTLFLLLILVFAAGCGSNDNAQEENQAADNQSEDIVNDNEDRDGEAEENDESIDVDKKILNVEVTIPADFLELDDEDQDIDEIIAEAKENGIKEVTENDDGSLTYKMSKSTHKEMMEEMEEELQNSIDDIVNDEEFASIQEITTNASFTELTMIVDKEPFENSFDGLSVLGLVFGSMYYQLFDGVDANDYEVIVNYEDAETGELFDEVIYPDAFEE